MGAERHYNLKHRSSGHPQSEGQVTIERNKIPCQKDVFSMSKVRGREGKQRNEHTALKLVSRRGQKNRISPRSFLSFLIPLMGSTELSDRVSSASLEIKWVSFS